MKTFEEYVKNLEFKVGAIKPLPGGMTLNNHVSQVSIICLETGFVVSINNSRSVLENRKLCLIVYREYLEELGLIKKDVSLQTITNNGEVKEQTFIEKHIGDLYL